jgi:hypothetical protein
VSPAHAPDVLPAGRAPHQWKFIEVILDQCVGFVLAVRARKEADHVLIYVRRSEFELNDVAHFIAQ